MTIEEIKENLCYYDLRNPDGVNFLDIDKSSFGNYTKENCSCDNCFYHKSKLANIVLDIIEHTGVNIEDI